MGMMAHVWHANKSGAIVEGKGEMGQRDGAGVNTIKGWKYPTEAYCLLCACLKF